jgi:uncharacterized delta-60 repeat protein
LVVFAILLLAVPSVNADGMLDPSFGNGGIVTTAFSGQQMDFARSVVVLPDGRAVAVGYTTPNLAFTYMAAARFLSSGALDPTFGIGGLVHFTAGPAFYDAMAEDALLQPDGRLVLIGRAHFFNGNSFAVARLTGNGTGDPSFGTNGWVNTAVPGGGSAVAGVLQADGKIVAVGGQSSPIAVRYKEDGRLDLGFGVGGIAAPVLPLSFVVRDVAVQSDGKLVIAGTYGSTDFALVRLLPDGVPDPSFDADGLATANFGGVESGESVVVLADGRLVLGGSHNGDFAVVRFLAGGAVDTTFGTGGLGTGDSGVIDAGGEVILLPNGKLVIAGFTSEPADRDFELARFHPGGALDTSFGTAGFLRTDIGAYDECHAVAVAGPDLVITAGSSSPQPPPSFNSLFALARYIATTPAALLSFEVE